MKWLSKETNTRVKVFCQKRTNEVTKPRMEAARCLKKIGLPQISQKFVFSILLNDIKSSLSKLNTIDPSFFYIIPVQAGEVLKVLKVLKIWREAPIFQWLFLKIFKTTLFSHHYEWDIRT